MKIIAAGASGFVGSRLLTRIRADGHEVVQLVRRTPKNTAEASWDPDAGALDLALLDGVDAVVNLCGAGVGDKRWNSRYREVIRTSRVRPTELLAGAAARTGVPVLVNASAVGYYGPTGNEVVDESAHAGTTFLAGVCVDWEKATTKAEDAGVRVVNLRTGLVLGREGGLLPKLSLITRLFAGGRLGSGRQYYPWISATDEIDAIRHLLITQVQGPANLTAPHPVTNAEFTRELGRALHRPTPWVVPTFALRLAVGDFAQEIVTGQNAVPTVLADSGFAFRHPTLAEALSSEIG